jgi:hypothetical protein
MYDESNGFSGCDGVSTLHGGIGDDTIDSGHEYASNPPCAIPDYVYGDTGYDTAQVDDIDRTDSTTEVITIIVQ